MFGVGTQLVNNNNLRLAQHSDSSTAGVVEGRGGCTTGRSEVLSATGGRLIIIVGI